MNIIEFSQNKLLNWISSTQNKTAVLLALNLGVCVNAQNLIGETPIFEAVKQEDYTIISLYINHNANINHKNNFGRTVIMELSLRKSHGIYSLNDSNCYSIQYILERTYDPFVSLNIEDNNGYTALMMAVIVGNVPVVRYLIKFIINQEISIKYKVDSVDLCKSFGHTQYENQLYIQNYMNLLQLSPAEHSKTVEENNEILTILEELFKFKDSSWFVLK
jgi:ankyrin repeat protein